MRPHRSELAARRSETEARDVARHGMKRVSSDARSQAAKWQYRRSCPSQGGPGRCISARQEKHAGGVATPSRCHSVKAGRLCVSSRCEDREVLRVPSACVAGGFARCDGDGRRCSGGIRLCGGRACRLRLLGGRFLHDFIQGLEDRLDVTGRVL